MRNSQIQFSKKCASFCRFAVLLIVSQIAAAFAQERSGFSIDEVSLTAPWKFVRIEVSSDKSETYQIEISKDMANWSLVTPYLAKFPGGSRRTTGFILPVPSSGYRFYRFVPKDDSEIRADLARNRVKWESLGIQSYTYITQNTCYCSSEEVQVSVVDGEIESIVTVRTGETIESDSYFTIDGLFDSIQSALDQPADFVQVNYHPVYGYPTWGDFDWSAEVSDEESGFIASLYGFVEISENDPSGSGGDAFEIINIELAGSKLRVAVRYSGGCSIHTFSLVMTPGSFAESNPVQANLYLRHDDSNDSCDGIVEEELEFDLLAIADLFRDQYQGDGQIRLNLHTVVDGVTQNETSILFDSTSP